MKTLNRSSKGFTLVEIMIVVVIIGLLAAMAIPAFQKVRQNSIGKAMENDARQLAAAAQQYILENAGVTGVNIGADTGSGSINTGPLSQYVRKISKGTSVGSYDGTATGAAFTMSNPQFSTAAVSFDAEGKKL
jgi:type IV pilus assembly protein PilA